MTSYRYESAEHRALAYVSHISVGIRCKRDLLHGFIFNRCHRPSLLLISTSDRITSTSHILLSIYIN